MKILITGGTGFLGLNLARRLLQKDCLMIDRDDAGRIDEIVLLDVSCPDRHPDGLDQRVKIASADIADANAVNALVDRDDMVIFHLASVVSSGGEKDFDLAMRVNLTGTLNLLEAARARAGKPRVVFASSLAVFGGREMPGVVSDLTKQTPQTTYGMIKSIGELLINDYSRKGYLDGRSARIPTVIVRPGRANAAASGFCSGIFREPLNGEDFAVPVSPDTLLSLLGYRTCIKSLIHLAELDAPRLGDDRAVALRNDSYIVRDMVSCLEGVAKKNNITLGKITFSRDHEIAKIIDGWPARIDTKRAEMLGFPKDTGLEQIIQDFIDDFC